MSPVGFNDALRAFVRESSRIEGIRRVLEKEVEAHRGLLRLDALSPGQLQDFVSVVAPGKRLRAYKGMDVRVGNHIAPRGGPDILVRLDSLLDQINCGLLTAWEAHTAYETLHPFMDGNGRSGRAVWLWHMLRDGRDTGALYRGFLHTFYYQTLGQLPALKAATASPAIGPSHRLDEPIPSPIAPETEGES